MVRIIADRHIPDAAIAFSDFGDVLLVDGRNLTRRQIGDAEVLLVRSVTQVDSSLLDGSKVGFVGTATSGTDHLDKAYLDERGIRYFDAAGCNARAVAEYVVACGFLCGKLATNHPGSLQAGIVGFGHVGKMVASLFDALGVRCVVNDPLLALHNTNDQFVSLDEVLASDIVTFHVPLTDADEFPTRGLIGRRQLDQLTPHALLINAARGGVIDEEALVDWCRTRVDGAIAIDCWESEPKVNLQLLRHALLATPHIAGHTIEARLRATTMLVSHLESIFDTASRWRAAAVEIRALTLPPDATMMKAIGDIVLACCDPRELTARMRETTELPGPKRAVEFDGFRRQAAVRREFSSFRVACDSAQPDTVACLGALGFETTDHGLENDG
jgi:erythronate-4-phosphate dehydrogenase